MANMNLVTGYIGSNHVTSNDVGSFNVALFGEGQYILNRGQKFAATVETNNKLRIHDGDLIMQGRHVRINEGDIVDLTIENGATDYNRNDLVVARYTKNASSGVEAVDLVVIKGTPVIGTAEDPAYTVGDIVNDGAMLNDMPLYRVEINGLSLSKVTFLAEEAQNIESILELLANKVSKSGHLSNKFLGTDSSGNVVTKEIPVTSVNGQTGAVTIGSDADSLGGVDASVYQDFMTKKTHTVTVNSTFVKTGSITAESKGGILRVGGYLQSKAATSTDGVTATRICTISGVTVTALSFASVIDHNSSSAKVYNLALLTENGTTKVQFDPSAMAFASGSWLNFTIYGVIA